MKAIGLNIQPPGKPHSPLPEAAGLLLTGKDGCGDWPGSELLLKLESGSLLLHPVVSRCTHACLPRCLVHCWPSISDITKAAVRSLSPCCRLCAGSDRRLTDPPRRRYKGVQQLKNSHQTSHHRCKREGPVEEGGPCGECTLILGKPKSPKALGEGLGQKSA